MGYRSRLGGDPNYLRLIVILAVVGIGSAIFGQQLFSILAGVGTVIWVFLVYSAMPICPHCMRKTHHIYTHRRVDGGPDLRYKVNPLVCFHCGAQV